MNGESVIFCPQQNALAANECLASDPNIVIQCDRPNISDQNSSAGDFEEVCEVQLFLFLSVVKCVRDVAVATQTDNVMGSVRSCDVTFYKEASLQESEQHVVLAYCVLGGLTFGSTHWLGRQMVL